MGGEGGEGEVGGEGEEGKTLITPCPDVNITLWGHGAPSLVRLSRKLMQSRIGSITMQTLTTCCQCM